MYNLYKLDGSELYRSGEKHRFKITKRTRLHNNVCVWGKRMVIRSLKNLITL